MSLLVWLPLIDNDLQNRGIYSKFAGAAVANTCNATIDNNGKLGKCYNFANYSGVGMTLNISAAEQATFMNEHINNHSWSMACWFQTSASVSTPVFGLTYGLILDVGTRTKVTLYNSSRTVTCDANTATNDGKWHHVAATYDVITNEVRIYIDGILKNSVYYTSGYTYASSWTNTLAIGRNHNDSTANASYFYIGKMNDARIYDHCLSAKEVKELSKGLILNYKLDDRYIEATTNLAGMGAPSGWNNSGACTRSNNDTSIPNIPEPTCSVYSQIETTAGQSAITFGTSTSNLPSKTLTYSMWFWKTGTSTGSTIGPYVRSTKTDGSVGSFSYNGDTNFRNWPSDRWLYVTVTFTLPSDATTVYVCAYTGGLNEKFAFNGWQLEEKDHATPFVNGSRNNTIVYDCSGYGNHGTIAGAPTVVSGSGRYMSSYKASDSASCIQTINLSNFIHDGYFSMSIWFKRITGEYSTKGWETLFGGPSGFEYSSKYNSTNSPNLWAYSWGNKTVSTYTCDEWHHTAMVRTPNDCKFYLDGELKYTGTAGSIPSGNYFFGAWNSSEGQNYRGHLSDTRIYATALSADDVLELYNTGACIDKAGNIETCQVDECVTTAPQVTKTAELQVGSLVECDENVKTLSDGSTWVRVLHHNNPASKLFTTSNCWYNTSDPDLFSALITLKDTTWRDSTGKYEFLVCEKATTSATEKQCRWSQTNNPVTETSVAGYTLISGSPGRTVGLRKDGSTYAVCHNGATWWCACGCWTAFSGGIPGFFDTVTTGYMDLYVRVPGVVMRGVTTGQAAMYNSSSLANQFLEI